MIITIHLDFTDGTEVSYLEGCLLNESFTTCCLDFFCFDYIQTPEDKSKLCSDVIVLKKSGAFLSARRLLDGSFKSCDKELRFSHNLQKMLKAGAFTAWER